MKRNINLFNGISAAAAPPKKRARTGLIAFIIVIALEVGVLGTLTALEVIKSVRLTAQINETSAYINDPGVVSKYTELMGLQSEIMNMRSYVALSGAAQELLKETPVFDLGVYGIINTNKPSRVILTAINYDGGRLTLTCRTTDNVPPADFAQSLDTCGAFTSVEYKGFNVGADGEVSFTIVCV